MTFTPEELEAVRLETMRVAVALGRDGYTYLAFEQDGWDATLKAVLTPERYAEHAEWCDTVADEIPGAAVMEAINAAEVCVFGEVIE